MFKTNDVVFFEDFGICHITDIEERTHLGELNKYYVLNPISDSKDLQTNISVSVNTTKIMRKVSSEKEIESLIHELPKLSLDWDTSSRRRELFYKECIKSGKLCNFAKVITYVYTEKKHYRENRKPFPSKDLTYFKKAQSFFNQEIAYVLHIKPCDVETYIEINANN